MSARPPRFRSAPSIVAASLLIFAAACGEPLSEVSEAGDPRDDGSPTASPDTAGPADATLDEVEPSDTADTAEPGDLDATTTDDLTDLTDLDADAPADELGVTQARFPWNGFATGSAWGERRADAHHTSRRPTFQWEPVAGADHYELRLDADCSSNVACDFPSPERFVFEATRVTLPVDLAVQLQPPVGTRYFWSVRACRQRPARESECSAWTATRYLDVGRERADYDGDGYAELVVVATAAAAADGDVASDFVFRGSPSGLEAMPSLQFTPPSAWGSRHSWAVANVGDVNGDGFGDFAAMGSLPGDVGSGMGTLSRPVALLHLGSSTGLSATASQVLEDLEPCKLRETVLGAGDLNGDGFADVVLATEVPGCSGDGDVGEPVLVYYGSAQGLVAGPRLALEGPFGSFGRRFGTALGGVGDVDGDGFPDLVVAITDWVFLRPALVYRGSAQGLSPTPDYQLEPPPEFVERFYFPVSLPSVADIDGDGFADIVASSRQYDDDDRAGEVFVYLGGSSGPPLRPSMKLANPSRERVFARNLTGGDLNGDGHTDVAFDVGALAISEGRWARVHLGGVTGLALDGAQLQGPAPLSVASPGDFDGNGSMDLVIAAGREDRLASVIVRYGSTSGLGEAIELVLADTNAVPGVRAADTTF